MVIIVRMMVNDSNLLLVDKKWFRRKVYDQKQDHSKYTTFLHFFIQKHEWIVLKLNKLLDITLELHIHVLFEYCVAGWFGCYFKIITPSSPILYSTAHTTLLQLINRVIKGFRYRKFIALPL